MHKRSLPLEGLCRPRVQHEEISCHLLVGTRRLFPIWQAWRDAEFYPTIYLDGISLVPALRRPSHTPAIEVWRRWPLRVPLELTQRCWRRARSSECHWARTWLLETENGPGTSLFPPFRKLEAYASLDPLALERRCRNRGLWTHSGTDQLPPSKSTLLQRLRLFESYWNHARAPKLSRTSTSDVLLEGREVTNNSVIDDIDGTPIEPLASADLHQRRRNLGDQFSGLRRSLSDFSLMLHIVLRT